MQKHIWHSDWDGKAAACPACGREDSLTPVAYDGDDGHELGVVCVVWFNCACGKKFKLGGIYWRVEKP
jgi:hypothetical protein